MPEGGQGRDTGRLRPSLCTGPWGRGNSRPVSLPRSRRRCGTSPRSSTTATRSGCAPSAAGTTSSRCWTSCRRATRGSGTACTAGRRCRSTRSWTPRPACPPCSSSPGRGGRAAEGEAHPAWRSPAGTPGCRDGATPPGGKAAATPVTPGLAIPGLSRLLAFRFLKWGPLPCQTLSPGSPCPQFSSCPCPPCHHHPLLAGCSFLFPLLPSASCPPRPLLPKGEAFSVRPALICVLLCPPLYWIRLPVGGPCTWWGPEPPPSCCPQMGLPPYQRWPHCPLDIHPHSRFWPWARSQLHLTLSPPPSLFIVFVG